MARWQIPEPLPFDWQMREKSSARITVRELPDGRLEQTIEHAPLPGVRLEMMLWMLANMGREIAWRGRRRSVYRCWHPVDHIAFQVLGRFGPGCRFHIVEAFQAKPAFLQEWTFDVPKLDRSGFRLELHGLGALLMSMDEDWEEHPDGMHYHVRQTVGSAAPVLKLFTRWMRRRRAAMLEAWLLHNVQEVGNLPHVLPELYATYAQ